MIKRYSAVFFILMANIIFLAHAVLPHHHHKGEVCFVDSHCKTDSKAHKHTTSKHNHKHATKEHSHDHDGNTDEQNCRLKQEVILPSNQLELEYESFDYVDNTNFCRYQANLTLTEFELLIQPEFSIKKPPLIPSFYSRIICTNKGMREPPIV